LGKDCRTCPNGCVSAPPGICAKIKPEYLVWHGLSAFVNPEFLIPYHIKGYFSMATSSGRVIEFLKTFYICTSWIPSALFIASLYSSEEGLGALAYVFGFLLFPTFLILVIVGFCLLVHSNNRGQSLTGLFWGLFASLGYLWIKIFFAAFTYLINFFVL